MFSCSNLDLTNIGRHFARDCPQVCLEFPTLRLPPLTYASLARWEPASTAAKMGKLPPPQLRFRVQRLISLVTPKPIVQTPASSKVPAESASKKGIPHQTVPRSRREQLMASRPAFIANTIPQSNLPQLRCRRP
jgi:hypothetical protein